MSGQRLVWITSGNTSRRSWSTCISHDVDESKMNFCSEGFLTVVGTPSFTKLSYLLSLLYPLFFRSLSMSASADLVIYPSVPAVCQRDTTWCVPQYLSIHIDRRSYFLLGPLYIDIWVILICNIRWNICFISQNWHF